MTCVQNEAIKYKNSHLHFAPTDLTAVNSLVWSQPQDSNSNVELMILLVTTSYVKFITGKLKVLCGNNLQFSTSLSYLAAVFFTGDCSSNRSFWCSFWWNLIMWEGGRTTKWKLWHTVNFHLPTERCFASTKNLLPYLCKTLQKIKTQQCKWSKVVKVSCVTPVKWALAQKYRCAAKMQPQLWKTKLSQNSNTFVNIFKYLTLLVCWMLLI